MKNLIAILAIALIGGCIYMIVESPSPTIPQPTKEISAEISKTETVLTIQNTGKEDWAYVEVYLNSLFGYRAAISLKAGEKANFSLIEFTKKDGLRFDPFAYKVSKVYIGGGDFKYEAFGF